DGVVAGGLMEGRRAIRRGIVTPGRPTLITSTHRDYALTEKMAMGDGRANASRVLESARTAARRFVGFDMATLAEETGSVISAVLFGAIAGSGALPFSREQYEQVIREGGKAVQANLAGFAADFEHASGAAPAAAAPAADAGKESREPHPGVAALLRRVQSEFPAPAHETLAHGVRRLIDYQDLDYAAEYLDRLAPVLKCDSAERGHRLVTEAARHLALWMSYEDTIRVADLKTRAARFERFR